MYVRVISYSFPPSVTVEQAEAIYGDMMKLTESLPGFQGLSLLINEETRQAISLSYWEDQASATEAGAVILPLLMERTKDLVSQPPEVTGFDLVRQTFVAGDAE